MSFTDMIKKSVLEGFTSTDLTTTFIVVTLAMAAILGMYIFYVYRFTCKSQFYSRSFNKSLAILPVITASILLAMSSNLVISLGMVGALSIVRFRNAVKDSMDLVFLFWSISVGIITGAGLFELALLTCAGISVFVFGLDYVPTIKAPCLLVVSTSVDSNEEVLIETIKGYTKNISIKSRNINMSSKEYIFELHVKDASPLLLDVSKIEGVTSVNMLNHSGELRV